MDNYKSKRKLLNLSIEKEFQSWLMLRIFGVIVLSSLLAAAILFFYAHQETVNSFYTAHIKIRRVSDLLLPVVLCGSAVSLVAGTFLAIFLPQKIAGPIYRIEKELQAVRQGDLTVCINLRRKDSLKSFAAVINSVIADLNYEVRQLQVAGERLEQAVVHQDKAELEASAQAFRQQLARLKI